MMDFAKRKSLMHCLMLLFVLTVTVCSQISATEKHEGKLLYYLELNTTTAKNNSIQFPPLNLSSAKLDWEGGSFPYEETPHDDSDNVFYDRAVVVAPIVGSVFIIFLVVVGVYLLRQYESAELPRGKDVESPCEHCSRTRTTGIRYKIQNYVMRIFDVSGAKQETFFMQMDPRSRTVTENTEARETLV